MKTFLTFALLLSASALAYSPEQQQISDAYSSADRVIYAEVASGSIIRSDEQICGTNYSLRVIRTFKGAPVPYLDIADRGSIIGTIGSKVLVFLHETDGFRPGDSYQYSGLSRFIDACTTNVPEVRPAQLMTQTYNPESMRDAFVVYERLLAVPDSIPKLCATRNENELMYPALVDKEDLFNYVNAIGSGT